MDHRRIQRAIDLAYSFADFHDEECALETLYYHLCSIRPNMVRYSHHLGDRIRISNYLVYFGSDYVFCASCRGHPPQRNDPKEVSKL